MFRKNTFATAAFVFSGLVALLVTVDLEAAEQIQDNSFLIEEAYNQEAGVVQHIFGYQRKTQGAWEASFTEEAPIGSQLHQVSLQIPLSRTADPSNQSGVGDVQLNYRYQLVANEHVAIAPRLSLVLPSGDSSKGLGSGATGAQVNLPVSAMIGPKWVTHVNFGFTFLPSAKSSAGEKSNATSGTFGASLIHLTTETFNLMAEFVGNIKESTNSANTVDRSATMIFNPGFRYAINAGDLQVVLGFSLPIEMVPGGGAVNQFYYLSFEHPLAMLK